MSPIADGYRWLRRQLASDDPRLALANTVVVAIVGNQPFYPAYVWWIAGGKASAACLTWASTPFFAAVPALARRHPRAGKILLLAAGIGNTALCAFAFGRASGVELFYLPCLALAVLLFGRRERAVAVAASIVLVAVLLLAAGGSRVAAFTPAEDASLTRLHAVSVASLLGLMGISWYRALRRFRVGAAG